MSIFTGGANELLMKTKMTGDAKVNKQLKGIEKTGLKSARTIQSSLGTAMKVFMAMAAVRQFTTWMQTNVKLAIAQEEAINDLEAALKSVGKYTPQLSRNLQKFASDLQGITIIGDETTLSIMATLTSLTDLDEEGLKKATESAIGIAKVFKLDVNAAALIVGKSIGSTTNALSRYGIQLDVTADQQTKVNELTEATAKHFDVAKAAVKTYSGRMVQLKNRYGDWREEIGKAITENDTLKGSMELLADAFKESTKEMESGMSDLGDTISNVVIGSVEALKWLGITAYRVGQGINAIAGVANILPSEIASGEVRMTEDLIKRFKSPDGFKLTLGERTSPAFARQARRRLKESLEIDLTEFEGATLTAQERERLNRFREGIGLKPTVSKEPIRQRGVAVLEELLPELRKEAGRREKIVEGFFDQFETGQTKLEAFNEEMNEVLATLRELKANQTSGGGGGGGDGVPTPTVPSGGKKGAGITSSPGRYVPFTTASNKAIIHARTSGATDVYSYDYPDAPLTPMQEFMTKGKSDRYIWGNVDWSQLSAPQKKMSRFEAGLYAAGLSTDKTPDADDVTRRQFREAIPGLVTAGMQGGEQFGRAAFGLGTTMGASAIGGPWGMAAALAANLAFGWLTKDRREDPSDIVSVKVVNISDIVSAMLRISGLMQIRDAASGVDRLMYLRQRKLNVM